MDIREPLLHVKTVPPQIRNERIARERLLKKLNGVFTVPVTLVCAPAGYGKTTLLVDWMDHAAGPVVWLALSPEENDPELFLNYFILALQSIRPEIGLSTQAAMNIPGAASPENCMHLLVNELSGLDISLALIMDDFHAITSPEVQFLTSHLLEHLPGQIHIVISTRVEPPLPLARLRARGQILELRISDLSFDQDEIGHFFNHVMNVSLPEDTCRQLARQTEGWVAALQLAAISMRGGDASLLEPVSSAGRHFIFDYLAEEVVSHLPAQMQEFLIKTSILEELTGDLCDELVAPFTPHKTGAECLEALEHANLFTQALDENHRWYRHHALFSDFLQNQLTRIYPEIIPDLHRRAARWLESKGLIDQAYRHAMSARDESLTAEIIENQAKILEARGELATLEKWLTKLPEDMVFSRPGLCLAATWVAFCRLDTVSIRKYLDRAETLLGDKDDPDIRGELMAARAFLAGMTDKAEETAYYSEQAMAYLRDDYSYLYCLLKINQSLPVMMSGNLASATAILEDAINYARRTNNQFIALLGMRMLGEAYIMQGRLSWAENLFLQGDSMIRAALGPQSPLIGVARMGLGEVYHQRNQISMAEKELEEGIEQVIDWMPAVVLDGLIWLANTHQSAGNLAGARRALQRAKEISLNESHPLLDEWMLDISTARINILQGNLEEGTRWARSTGLDLDGLTNLDGFYQKNPAYFRVSSHITLARLFLVLGRRENIPGALEKVTRILEPVLTSAREMGETSLLIEGLLIQAQAYALVDRDQHAMDCVHEALDLAAPEGAICQFLDEGQAVISLIEKRNLSKIPSFEKDFIRSILSAWSQPKVTRVEGSQPVEVLSFRELEVLRWMAEGKSNQEIAEGLVLSLNTVKKHVSAVMGKLDAKNRSMAVIIGRKQNLID
jgi:LuxR family maltose regulon positive regulatory protein